MATLTTLVNNVLPEIKLPTLSTIVGNTNQTAQLVLALANRQGISMAKHPWRILTKRHEFDTVSSIEAYALPSDFDYFVHGTEWNEDNSDPMDGPLADDRWQADLSGLTTVTVNDRFQVRADGNLNRFFVRPVPTSAETLTYFYVSNGWCQSKGGTRQSEWLADTDIFLLDDYVFELGFKVRMLRAQRRDFAVELQEYLRELEKVKARDGGMKTYRILGPVEDTQPVANVPETGFGS